MMLLVPDPEAGIEKQPSPTCHLTSSPRTILIQEHEEAMLPLRPAPDAKPS